MKSASQSIINSFVLLTLLNTLAASLIYGINTLFLLDAGLTNTQAFAANAFFTLGLVLFEVPTGIIADSMGRRKSYLLGTITLSISTLLYLFAWQTHAVFCVWAVTSILLGLGFTFFSGATEAWLVDALHFTEFKGDLESVFAKGQVTGGIAMLVGSVAGGYIAQITNLGVPYIVRAVILGINFVAAFIIMRDLGFSPTKSESLMKSMKQIFIVSAKHGFKNPDIRWVMIAGIFSTGVSFYAFYALQPYLLQLYGDEKAYGIAGLAAAIAAGAQIVGGLTFPFVRKLFHKRISLLLTGVVLSSLLLLGIGITSNFWIVIIFIVLWGLVFAATLPVRQAYLNDRIPSTERATVLSFDSLVGSSGGIVIQPILGKTADVWGYPLSYGVSALIQLIAFPFTLLARRNKSLSDPFKT